jgi:hypothetical protein
MEQPCYKCGQGVEEGVTFCPHCAAPQIRVMVAEPTATAVSGAAADVLPPASVFPASETLPGLAVPMHWSQALKPCALAALVASILLSLGLNPFVAMLCVGFLAAVFYRQGHPGIPIRPGTGARLGAIGGLLWFAMSSILEALVVLFFHKGAEVRQNLLQVIDQAASRTNDQEVLAVFSRLKTPQGLEVLMIVGLATVLVAAVILGTLGGALAGTIFGRKNQP